MKTIILIFALLIGSSSVVADPVAIKRGFFTGNDFLQLSQDDKRDYVIGMTDGLLLAPIFGAPKAEMKWVEDCLTDMNNVQISAILEFFLKNNPARWHQQMNILTFVALKENCS